MGMKVREVYTYTRLKGASLKLLLLFDEQSARRALYFPYIFSHTGSAVVYFGTYMVTMSIYYVI